MKPQGNKQIESEEQVDKATDPISGTGQTIYFVNARTRVQM